MISLRMVGTEVSALGAAALSMPLRFVVERDRFDPSSPYPTPVVLVHGLFGDPTNFLLLRRYLATRGMRNRSRHSWATASASALYWSSNVGFQVSLGG